MNHFMIDGFGLAYRSYYAFSSLSTGTGLDSGCIYGFLVSLRSLKKKYPDFHFNIAWDRGSQRRRELYAEYKANRDGFSIDEPIRDLKKILNSVNMSQMEQDGEEADDIIASFVFKNQDNLVYIYSSDKDLLQLVRDGKVIVIKPKSGGYPEKIFDEGAVKSEYGVRPEDFASFQAFRGDSVDNIPGVPRLPSKIIAYLISKYKRPQTVYASLDSEKLTDFQRKNLNDFRKQVCLNYSLTRLNPEIDYIVTEGSSDEEILNLYLNKYEIKSISAVSFLDIFEKESSFLNRRAPAIQNFSLF